MSFQKYCEGLSREEKTLLQGFFDDFSSRCLLSKLDKTAMREDFEQAILYFAAMDLPLPEILERLDMRNLGGFYARPPVMWFPLDDAAKTATETM